MNLNSESEQRRGNLRLKDNLLTVVKGDSEASSKVTANKGFIAKYANDGSTYPCVSKFCNFYPADIPQFGQPSFEINIFWLICTLI